MPAFADIRAMIYGQAFQKPWVPQEDLSGKTAIVTGSNTGIGLEVVKHLVHLGAKKVIIACRNTAKGEEARRLALEKSSCDIEVWELDLCKKASVIAFNERVRSQLQRLDIFIANAGMEVNEYEETERLEKTLMVNVVGTFTTVIGALSKLRTTAQHQTITHATIVGSVFHVMAPAEQLIVSDGVDVFDALSNKESADMQGRYALSKLMVHQCSHELARHVSERGDGLQNDVVVNVVNPGWCKTSLTRDLPDYPLPQQLGFKLIGWTAEEGSRAVTHAALSGTETHGAYVSECRVKCESEFMRSAKGRQVQKTVWDALITRVNLFDPESLSLL